MVVNNWFVVADGFLRVTNKSASIFFAPWLSDAFSWGIPAIRAKVAQKWLNHGGIVRIFFCLFLEMGNSLTFFCTLIHFP
jgi:hypothetical protein